MKKTITASLCLFILALSGCHLYHLQHHYVPEPIYYKPTGEKSFDRIVDNILTEQLFHLVKASDKADYLLHISKPRKQARYESAAIDGAAREQIVIVSISYKLTDTKGNIVVKETHLSKTRRVTLNTQQPLSLELSKESLSSSIQRDLVITLGQTLQKKLAK